MRFRLSSIFVPIIGLLLALPVSAQQAVNLSGSIVGVDDGAVAIFELSKPIHQASSNFSNWIDIDSVTLTRTITDASSVDIDLYPNQGSVSDGVVVTPNDSYWNVTIANPDGTYYVRKLVVPCCSDTTWGAVVSPNPSAPLEQWIPRTGGISTGKQTFANSTPIRLVPGSQPSNPTAGDCYVDSTTGILYVYSGSAWIGTSVLSLTATDPLLSDTGNVSASIILDAEGILQLVGPFGGELHLYADSTKVTLTESQITDLTHTVDTTRDATQPLQVDSNNVSLNIVADAEGPLIITDLFAGQRYLSFDSTRVTLTESQITDLAHTVDTTRDATQPLQIDTNDVSLNIVWDAEGPLIITDPFSGQRYLSFDSTKVTLTQSQVTDLTHLWADIDFTGANITSIPNRSHTDLQDIGTNTHAQIDTAITNSVNHIADTANPHGTDFGNLGTGTLAELNLLFTDGTVLYTGAHRDATQPLELDTNSVSINIILDDEGPLRISELMGGSRYLYLDTLKITDTGLLSAADAATLTDGSNADVLHIHDFPVDTALVPLLIDGTDNVSLSIASPGLAVNGSNELALNFGATGNVTGTGTATSGGSTGRPADAGHEHLTNYLAYNDASFLGSTIGVRLIAGSSGATLVRSSDGYAVFDMSAVLGWTSGDVDELTSGDLYSGTGALTLDDDVSVTGNVSNTASSDTSGPEMYLPGGLVVRSDSRADLSDAGTASLRVGPDGVLEVSNNGGAWSDLTGSFSGDVDSVTSGDLYDSTGSVVIDDALYILGTVGATGNISTTGDVYFDTSSIRTDAADDIQFYRNGAIHAEANFTAFWTNKKFTCGAGLGSNIASLKYSGNIATVDGYQGLYLSVGGTNIAYMNTSDQFLVKGQLGCITDTDTSFDFEGGDILHIVTGGVDAIEVGPTQDVTVMNGLLIAEEGMKLTPMTDPTDPVTGTVWDSSDDKGLKAQGVHGESFVNRTAEVATVDSSQIPGTAGKTYFDNISMTVYAGDLVVGSTYHVEAWGRYTTDAAGGTPTITIGLDNVPVQTESGAVTILSGSPTLSTSDTDLAWHIEGTFIVQSTGAGTGTWRAYSTAFAPAGSDTLRTAGSTLDTTVDTNMRVFATWGGADAGEDIEMEGFILHHVAGGPLN